jgi:plasmid stabilization system protein ParE
MKLQKYKIELSKEAEEDFDNSYYYYAKESQKVADNFLKQVDSSFVQILKNPEGYVLAIVEIRKYVMKKYPFVIYYRVQEAIIQIVAIFHSSRNPEIWKERTEK